MKRMEDGMEERKQRGSEGGKGGDIFLSGLWWTGKSCPRSHLSREIFPVANLYLPCLRTIEARQESQKYTLDYIIWILGRRGQLLECA